MIDVSGYVREKGFFGEFQFVQKGGGSHGPFVRNAGFVAAFRWDDSFIKGNLRSRDDSDEERRSRVISLKKKER